MDLPHGYELDEERGAGVAFATATDGTRVVIKELVLGRVGDWKEVELFEREVATLRQLEHPAIPTLIDDLRGGGDAPTYFLIAEWVDGQSLETLAETMKEERLKSVARQLLEVLVYLQSFSPPVLHRNITPDAVIVRPDDSVTLVDFGSVQVELQATVGGSTMVGTSGYMAPEQLLGRAEPSSDLYALGATLVRVLTGGDPGELSLDRMQLQWREHARYGSERFLDWVDRLLCPEPTMRFSNAEEALRALNGGAFLPALRGGEMLASRPSRTKVQFSRRSGRLTVEIPASGLLNRTNVALLAACVAALSCAFVVEAGAPTAAVGGVFLVCVLLTAWNLGRAFLERGRTELSLDVDRGFRLKHRGIGRKDGRGLRVGSLDDIVGVEAGFGGHRDSLWLTTRGGMLPLGRGLTPEEQAWLCAEFTAFFREELHRRGPRRNMDEWLQQKLSDL